MTDTSENLLVKTERDNLKYGVLSLAVGLVAIFGSAAIPNHNRQLRDLETSLVWAGYAVAFKGAVNTLDAIDRLDRLDSDDDT